MISIGACSYRPGRYAIGLSRVVIFASRARQWTSRLATVRWFRRCDGRTPGVWLDLTSRTLVWCLSKVRWSMFMTLPSCRCWPLSRSLVSLFGDCWPVLATGTNQGSRPGRIGARPDLSTSSFGRALAAMMLRPSSARCLTRPSSDGGHSHTSREFVQLLSVQPSGDQPRVRRRVFGGLPSSEQVSALLVRVFGPFIDVVRDIFLDIVSRTRLKLE